MGRALDCTSAYICSFEAETFSSKVLADFVSSEANVFEQASDLGVTYQLDQEFPYSLSSITEGHTIIIHENDPELPPIEREHMLTYGAQSILLVPLRVAGKTVAYAELWESRLHRHFTQAEIELAQIMAGQAAIVMENAGLFTSIAEERGRLEALIQSSRDGVILVGLDRQILVINDMALRFFQLPGSPKDWINQPLRKALMALRQSAPQVVTATLEEIRRLKRGRFISGQWGV